MFGAISEATMGVKIKKSAESMSKMDAEVELDEDEDDFMDDTYLAINLDVKVRESQLNNSNTRKRNGGQTSSAQDADSKPSGRYHSRLSAETINKARPFSKESK